MDRQTLDPYPRHVQDASMSAPESLVTEDMSPDRVLPGSVRCCGMARSKILLGVAVVASFAAAAGLGYQLGYQANVRSVELPMELLRASATHSSTNMAVATGKIDQESEGIFFLDYLTGDLQCWVFYPRTGQFGAKFTTNVTAQLPGGKNAEYIMVTGNIVVPQAGGNARLANSLVYVVDSRAGVFAAYGVPWNRSMENSGQVQVGQLVPVGGGQIRLPVGGLAQPAPGANQGNPPNGNP